MGLYEKSIKYFQKAKRLERQPIILKGLAGTYYAMEKYEDSLMCFKESLELNSDISQADCNLFDNEVFRKKYDFLSLKEKIRLQKRNSHYFEESDVIDVIIEVVN
jgi:tetratricopeptide (TPR) repeat protein